MAEKITKKTNIIVGGDRITTDVVGGAIYPGASKKINLVPRAPAQAVQLTAQAVQVDCCDEFRDHRDDMDNPHEVTPAQLGNTTAQWNANKIQDKSVSTTDPDVGDVLIWSGSSWTPTEYTTFALASTAESNAGVISTKAVAPSGLLFIKSGTAFLAGDMSGNARGTRALDIQTARSVAAAVASGTDSVAIGNGNTASGVDSFAVGHNNTASTTGAMAYGHGNSTSGSDSVIIGHDNTISGNYSTTIGADNSSSSLHSFIFGRYNFLAGSTTAIAIGVLNNYSAGDIDGGGNVTGTPAAAAAIGDKSIAIGTKNIASGDQSIAIGDDCQAATAGIAIGFSNTSSGDVGVAIGAANIVSGDFSASIGVNNTLSGNYGAIFGSLNVSGSNYSQLFGTYNFSSNSSYASISLGLMNNQTGGTLDPDTGIISGTPAASPSIGKSSVAVGINNANQQRLSTAFGINNQTIAENTTAVGIENFVGNDYSTSTGWSNFAPGLYSTSMGYQNYTGDEKSTSVGFINFAFGKEGSAVGFENIASGMRSSSFGNLNKSGCNPVAFTCVAGDTQLRVVGEDVTSQFSNGNTVVIFPTDPENSESYEKTIVSVALDDTDTLININSSFDGDSVGGYVVDSTKASYALTAGYKNCAFGVNANAVGQQNFANSVFSVALGVVNNSSGATLNSSTGIITGTVVASTIGKFSTSVGIKNIASGDFTVSAGYENVASSNFSCAIGISNSATDSYAVALGVENTASGDYSYAIGKGCTVSGDYSIGFGTFNTVAGLIAVSIGTSNTASATYSMAIGSANNATLANGIAIGRQNAVSGAKGICIGTSNTSSNVYAIAVGSGNTASAEYAIAIGRDASAAGSNSISIGEDVHCTNPASISIGMSNTVSGYYCAAIGFNLTNSVNSCIDIGPDNTHKLKIDAADGVQTVGMGLYVTNAAAGRVHLLESTVTNDNVREEVWQARTTTSGAVTTAIQTFNVSADSVLFVDCIITARSSGNDCAAYELKGAYRLVAGNATIIGSVTKVAYEVDSAWDVAIGTSSATININVTGNTADDIVWHITTRHYTMSI